MERQARGNIVGYRLGFYDPDPDKHGVRLFGGLFSGSPQDRLTMRLAVQKYVRWADTQPEAVPCVGVFTVRDNVRDTQQRRMQEN